MYRSRRRSACTKSRGSGWRAAPSCCARRQRKPRGRSPTSSICTSSSTAATNVCGRNARKSACPRRPIPACRGAPCLALSLQFVSRSKSPSRRLASTTSPAESAFILPIAYDMNPRHIYHFGISQLKRISTGATMMRVHALSTRLRKCRRVNRLPDAIFTALYRSSKVTLGAG